MDAGAFGLEEGDCFAVREAGHVRVVSVVRGHVLLVELLEVLDRDQKVEDGRFFLQLSQRLL